MCWHCHLGHGSLATSGGHQVLFRDALQCHGWEWTSSFSCSSLHPNLLTRSQHDKDVSVPCKQHNVRFPTFYTAQSSWCVGFFMFGFQAVDVHGSEVFILSSSLKPPATTLVLFADACSISCCDRKWTRSALLSTWATKFSHLVGRGTTLLSTGLKITSVFHPTLWSCTIFNCLFFKSYWRQEEHDDFNCLMNNTYAHIWLYRYLISALAMPNCHSHL